MRDLAQMDESLSHAVVGRLIFGTLKQGQAYHLSNMQMHKGIWNRYFGKRISNTTIGIIGLGRIGMKVLNQISAFGTPRLLVNDLNYNHDLSHIPNIDIVSKEKIYKEADVISLHLPLTATTKNMICRKELEMMKSDSSIINTSRGGIINEKDLFDVMKKGHLSGAAIDVFDNEPYSGNLLEIERCLLTAHMGSMSIDCRTQMEIEATEEAMRFIVGKPLEGEVPDEEYAVQREGL